MWRHRARAPVRKRARQAGEGLRGQRASPFGIRKGTAIDPVAAARTDGARCSKKDRCRPNRRGAPIFQDSGFSLR
jgi:hypothetical protein